MPVPLTTRGEGRGLPAPRVTNPVATRRAWGATRRLQRGAVTAETAVVLPVLVAFVLALVWVISLAAAQVRVVDAAREAARAAARGDPAATAVAWGRRVAPDGASIQLSRQGGGVVVEVTAPVRGPGGLLGFLPGVTVHARSVAAAESP